MSLVSVIVPIYNSEKYLKECIDSLLGQSFIDFKLILVNDGSTDSSLEICNKYKDVDDRVVLINKENEGAGKTRKAGIDAVNTEFVCFVDSDDFVEKEFLESLIERQRQSNADIVECGYNVFSGEKKPIELFNESVVFDEKDFKEKVIKNTIVDGTVAVVLWNKLYKTELLKQAVTMWGNDILEDYLINMQYYACVKRYCYVNSPLINYRVVKGSLSRKFQPRLYSVLKEVVGIKLDYMKAYGLSDNDSFKANANWVVRYTFNYLKMGCTVSGFKEKVKEILKDDMLNEMCALCEGNLFAKAVVERNYKKAYKILRRAGKKEQIKRKLYAILHH